MGNLVIVSGFPATGTGKTTVVARVLLLLEDTVRNISCTTRPMREKEVDGKDYHFLSQKTFKEELDAGNFLEHDEHYGHLYGVRTEDVLPLLALHKAVILTIDLAGAKTLKALYPHAYFIAISASTKNAASFMKQRGDSPEKISGRLARTQLRKEKKIFSEIGFDVVIENIPGALESTVAQVAGAIRWIS